MCLYTGTNKLNETTQIVNLHSEDSKFVSIQFQDSEISDGRSLVSECEVRTNEVARTTATSIKKFQDSEIIYVFIHRHEQTERNYANCKFA